jgi:hypothetical protein
MRVAGLEEEAAPRKGVMPLHDSLLFPQNYPDREEALCEFWSAVLRRFKAYVEAAEPCAQWTVDPAQLDSRLLIDVGDGSRERDAD